MKHLLFVFAIALCLVCFTNIPSYAFTQQMMMVSGGGDVCSCSATPFDGGSTEADDANDVASDDDNYYAWGNHDFVVATNSTICRVDVRIWSITGDLTGQEWVVEIWTTDGSDNLVAKQGNSDTVLGQNLAAGATYNQFDFSVPVSLVNPTEYAIIFTRNGFSSTNYLSLGVDSGGGTLTGTIASWGVDNQIGINPGTKDACFKVYKCE